MCECRRMYILYIGDEGVDHELLLQHTEKENIILMNNGCICCTVRKDIIDTFHVLFNKIQNLTEQIDWVVIETTGVAGMYMDIYMCILVPSVLILAYDIYMYRSCSFNIILIHGYYM